mgnify:CR=1 FL=1
MKETIVIHEAIPLLKQGEILKKVSKPVAYFVYQNEKIWVHTELSRIHISLEDFLDLYEIESFTVHQPKELIEINTEKDKEYYSWWK